jgi:hypothetical protein
MNLPNFVIPAKAGIQTLRHSFAKILDAYPQHQCIKRIIFFKNYQPPGTMPAWSARCHAHAGVGMFQ